jgi:hypothetical protein
LDTKPFLRAVLPVHLRSQHAKQNGIVNGFSLVSEAWLQRSLEPPPIKNKGNPRKTQNQTTH